VIAELDRGVLAAQAAIFRRFLGYFRHFINVLAPQPNDYGREQLFK
jgi:hypothetical protein